MSNSSILERNKEDRTFFDEKLNELNENIQTTLAHLPANTSDLAITIEHPVQVLKDLIAQAREQLEGLVKSEQKDKDKALEILKELYHEFARKLTQSCKVYDQRNKVLYGSPLFKEEDKNKFYVLLTNSCTVIAKYFGISDVFNAYLFSLRNQTTGKTSSAPPPSPSQSPPSPPSQSQSAVVVFESKESKNTGVQGNNELLIGKIEIPDEEVFKAIVDQLYDDLRIAEVIAQFRLILSSVKKIDIEKGIAFAPNERTKAVKIVSRLIELFEPSKTLFDQWKWENEQSRKFTSTQFDYFLNCFIIFFQRIAYRYGAVIGEAFDLFLEKKNLLASFRGRNVEYSSEPHSARDVQIAQIAAQSDDAIRRPTILIQEQFAKKDDNQVAQVAAAGPSAKPFSSDERPMENGGGIQMTDESRKEEFLPAVNEKSVKLQRFYDAPPESQKKLLENSKVAADPSSQSFLKASLPGFFSRESYLQSQLITDLDAYLRALHNENDGKYSRPEKSVPLEAFVAALNKNGVSITTDNISHPSTTTNFYVPDSAQTAADIRRGVPPAKRLDATNLDVKKANPATRKFAQGAVWVAAGALMMTAAAGAEYREGASWQENDAYNVATYLPGPISQASHDALHMSSPHTDVSEDKNYGPDYNAQKQEAMKSVSSLFAFVQNQVVNPDAVKAMVNPNPEVARKHYDANGNFVGIKAERVTMPSRVRLNMLLTKGEIKIMPGEVGVADAIAHAFIEAFPESKAQITEFLNKFNKTSALYYVNRSLNADGTLEQSEEAYLKRSGILQESESNPNPKLSHLEQDYLHNLGITDADAQAFGQHFQKEFNHAVIYDPGSSEGRPLGDLSRNVKPGTIVKTHVGVEGIDTNKNPYHYEDQLTFVKALAAIVNVTVPKEVYLHSIETTANTSAHSNIVGNTTTNQVNTPLTPGSGVVIQPDAGAPNTQDHQPSPDGGVPDDSTDADKKHGFLDLPKQTPARTKDGIITYTAANIDQVLENVESLEDGDYELIDENEPQVRAPKIQAVNTDEITVDLDEEPQVDVANEELIDADDEVIVDLDQDIDTDLPVRIAAIKANRKEALFQQGEICLPGKQGQPLDVAQVLKVVSDGFVQLCQEEEQMKAVHEYITNKGAEALSKCEKLPSGEVYAQLNPTTLKMLHALTS